MTELNTNANSQPRKLVVVAPWFFGGGAQAALTSILRRLSGAHVEVKLIVLFAGSTGIDALRAEVTHLVELNCSKSPLGALKAAWALETHLTDADAVYSLMRASHLVLGLRSGRLLPRTRPFIASFHQMPSADSAGIIGKIEDLFVRRAVRRAELISAPSRRALAELATSNFARPDQLVYEPNGLAEISSPRVAPRDGELPSVRLLFAGRLTEQKGLDRVPALLMHLDRPVELRILGAGPQEQRIKDAVSAVAPQHTMTFVGEVDDVVPHIDWCDALLMPSRSELNPVFLWEGRQRGRGAFTSDIPAFRDLAAEGGVVIFNDTTSLSSALRDFATDATQRNAWFDSLPDLARPLSDPAQPSPLISALSTSNCSVVGPAANSSRGVLVLHGYSAENAGDGLLVRETIEIIREALGQTAITLIASRPETFADLDVVALPAVPTGRGWDARTRHALATIDTFDMAIAVGGGYLRGGTIIEAAKTALVHAPQLRAAARSSIPTLYLPQSVGPARFGTHAWLSAQLKRVDEVMVRDDRSLKEFSVPTVRRTPDLATAAATRSRRPGTQVEPTPVLSIRAVRGRVNGNIYRLASLLDSYYAYVQSTTGGNDDRPATATLSPLRVLRRDELMNPGGTPRVVVAVRLHAALMALAAGHYVVHLSYERKGFGAFSDLGIDPWVHNVNHFDPLLVSEQVRELLSNPEVRNDYDSRIESASKHIAVARARIVDRLRGMAPKV